MSTFLLPGSSQAQEANSFLDDTRVQILNVTMDPGDWATLRANYLENTYYHANLSWNGMAVSLGIRSHGGGSRSPIKPNLDLNFSHYTKGQTFLGLPFVLLKAGNEDPSNMREWLSMKLFRRMGISAPREAPTQLFVNGELLGMYYIVEHEDESFLTRNFGESGGYLYEWQYQPNYDWGNLGTDPNAYAPLVDLKTNQATPDLQTLEKFIQAVNATPTPESTYISGLAGYMDPKLFLSYCATENVLADIDGILDGESGLNNIYLYQLQNTTLYQLIPWDKDQAFSDVNRSILQGVTAGTNINILAQRLYGFSDYKAVYLEELTRAANLLGSTGGWADSELTREYAVIRSAALNDPNKQCDYTGAGPSPCGVQDTEAAVENLHTFLAQRAGVVTAQAAAAGYQPLNANPKIQSVSVLSPGYSIMQVSPGALVSVSGLNLGPAANAPSVPLPRTLGTTFVAIDGVRAPLLSTAAGQIQFEIPGDTPTGLADIAVSTGGAIGNTLTVDVWSNTPVLLAAVRSNGTSIVAGNPPAPNEAITIYALGLGAVTPDVAAGATATTLASTVNTPQITLGNATLNLLFSGLTPGFVGLYQVNAQMPPNLPAGASAQLTIAEDGQLATLPIALQ